MWLKHAQQKLEEITLVSRCPRFKINFCHLLFEKWRKPAVNFMWTRFSELISDPRSLFCRNWQRPTLVKNALVFANVLRKQNLLVNFNRITFPFYTIIPSLTTTTKSLEVEPDIVQKAMLLKKCLKIYFAMRKSLLNKWSEIKTRFG